MIDAISILMCIIIISIFWLRFRLALNFFLSFFDTYNSQIILLNIYNIFSIHNYNLFSWCRKLCQRLHLFYLSKTIYPNCSGVRT
jgi:hypothetical protein